ncbi:predicted protein [Plenodomus lingam JN3]|uniref:Predicted protein n=1 Tax=Leptosphaeria maculans (strain JN3 / isolate v23.1.3 / race Av1-4-5-6-7-8) TaxID=985895 RepID=E5R4F9_LEPMJ|nr:predicted protein [Plenodomus lingam JN3]CBX91927.1 predicted protein [Plenodomus lingam JN3]
MSTRVAGRWSCLTQYVNKAEPPLSPRKVFFANRRPCEERAGESWHSPRSPTTGKHDEQRPTQPPFLSPASGRPSNEANKGQNSYEPSASLLPADHSAEAQLSVLDVAGPRPPASQQPSP